MPFEKGRPKTGGRQKGSVTAARKSTKFVEQLKGYGFNYPKELSEALLALKELRNPHTDSTKAADAVRAALELKTYYSELKSLLPYMAPKLREKEVETADEEVPTEAPKPVSDDELLKMLDKDDQPSSLNTGRSGTPGVEPGNPQLPVPAGTEENLPNLAGEQEED